MTLGQVARAVLGPAFKPAAWLYRRVFVNMPKVIDELQRHVPHGAHVLEIGGGDGYAANLLLAMRSDVRVTMTDLAPIIGGFIASENEPRATLLPSTDMRDVRGRFDAVLVADVLHHVPVHDRETFLHALGEMAQRVGAGVLLIKDVEPGHFRSLLSLWADRYISGDKNVALMPSASVAVPGFSIAHRLMPDPPNYATVLYASM